MFIAIINLDSCINEIAYLMRVFGKFRYRKLSALGNRLLKAALQEQRRITGAYWGVFRFRGFTEDVSSQY